MTTIVSQGGSGAFNARIENTIASLSKRVDSIESPPLSRRFITVGGSYTNLYPIFWTTIKYDAIHGHIDELIANNYVKMRIRRDNPWNRAADVTAVEPQIPLTFNTPDTQLPNLNVTVEAVFGGGQKIINFTSSVDDSLAYLTTPFRARPETNLDPGANAAVGPNGTPGDRDYQITATGGWFRGGGLTYLFESSVNFDLVDFYHITDYTNPVLNIPENTVYSSASPGYSQWKAQTISPIIERNTIGAVNYITSSNINGAFYTNNQGLGISAN